MEDPNKPVTGYPPGYHQGQSSYNSNGYPPAQSSYSAASTATGTSYPYTAPLPAAYYNTNPYYTPPYDQRRTTFFRRFIAAIIAVFLIIGAITFIVWLVLHPHVPEFRVDSVSVSSLNINNSQVTGNWDVGFTVRNPNKKMSVHYDNMFSTLFYRRQSLSDTSLPPLSQGKKNETTVRARFAASSGYIGDAASALASDRSSGSVSFNVNIGAWVWFKAGAWRTRRHLLRVFCEDLKVGFSSNTQTGVLSGGPKNCEVDL
ncbi:PREDICTED: NDR1/HIN1-Like protein 3-like [Nelumbo nucifera]|uniref:Late embryogenesis abundant protein LEA-2 subgroup domain-containing protein n=2 Tax=Nelumbo nucifera TaxID=4432 RepID=A0A822ZZ55_NELNU|nr:PREDICTED: NDR1/HIN1-Like protein 3-like [Nelumbo nucifera]DAD48389.1 TPA_asm: hypothetical protein HUJ06_018326 [Nelumbo nucifera]